MIYYSRALITGASSGIGLELARVHAERGGNLILVARREDKLREIQQELQQKHGVDVVCIQADLSEPDVPRRVFEQVRSGNIVPDYLINNAGFGDSGELSGSSVDRVKNLIQVNVTALTVLTRLFLPEMMRRGEGRIMNVSSVASLLPGGPYMAVYYASKSFVTSFSLALAEELRGSRVTVTCLLPGATATGFGKVADLEGKPLFSRPADARDVARKGYKAMKDGKSVKICGFGFFNRCMLKFLPLFPQRFVLKTVGNMQK